MMSGDIKLGTRVLVRDIFTDETRPAIVAGWYDRMRDQFDCNSLVVIAPKGRVYRIRYEEGYGLYNIHENFVSVGEA